ncbi:MAG: pyruvate ferredoxin oxidoreductase, partial [Deltaproteobacteria bacterium]|nr:pyruvate ferredoxin oxidoreductase [Deltaproteobacteria bacterium]
IKYGRLAVETGVFPLYEIKEGRYRITYNPEPLRPIRDYLKGQGRFRHLTDEHIEYIQQRTTAQWEELKRLSSLK